MTQNKPINIYLADLTHNYVKSRDIWTVPFGVGTISSYCKKHLGDNVKIRLFKFPDKLIEAIEREKPDILGLSNYIWNDRLTRFLSRETKARFDDTLVVVGGPNATLEADWMGEFFDESKADFYVSWAGEDPFLQIVKGFIETNGEISAIAEKPYVHGVWHRPNSESLALEKPTTTVIKDLDEIPSPYLTGELDPFLDDLLPTMETSRGCPFKCTFCDWGNASLGKVYQFSYERICDEVTYISGKTKDDRLMFCDANFGIIPDRDLEISKHLVKTGQDTGFPNKLICTWNQKKSDKVLSIAKELKDLCMMTTSSQTLNPNVQKTIKRMNISDEEWAKLYDFCHSSDVDLYGEVMLSLPAESFESFIEGIRKLYNYGCTFININPLILLFGAEMNIEEQRKEFKMKTRWRLLENCYGIYWGKPVLEAQEMVVGTVDLQEQDYYRGRILSWLMQMSWNLRRHDGLIRIAYYLGENPVDFLLRAVDQVDQAPEKVTKLFSDFMDEAIGEMYASRSELETAFSSDKAMNQLQNGGFRKLNTHYSSRASLECAEEFIDYYKALVIDLLDENLPDYDQWLTIIDDMAAFMGASYLSIDDLKMLSSEQSVVKDLALSFDAPAYIKSTRGADPRDFMTKDVCHYSLYLDDDQCKLILEHTSRFEGLDWEYQMRKLQEPYHGIHKKHLLFRYERINQSAKLAAS